MIKKMTSIFIAVIMTMFCMSCISASAYDVSPRYGYTASCSSTLSISGASATCESSATGYSGETTKIVISQTLQKRGSSGNWSDVSGAYWKTTIYKYVGSARKVKNNLSSGTYRLKSVFTVYAGNSSETITKYSQQKSI